MENCKMSGKSQGILRWMLSGNPALLSSSKSALDANYHENSKYLDRSELTVQKFSRLRPDVCLC